MKKLLHIELQEAAGAIRDGNLSADEFFPKLVTLLRDHLENLGLSERATRYCLYSHDPKDWSCVKDEFQSQEVVAGLRKAEAWTLSISRKSRAFRLRHTDKVPGISAKELPILSSIMWKYHYRHFEPHPEPPPSVGGAPVFYKPQPTERTSADVKRWV